MFRNFEKKADFTGIDMRIHDVSGAVEFTNNMTLNHFSKIS